MNQALDRSYSDLERELLRTYPNYTAESKPDILATQRGILLTRELSQQLILINPEREAEITARYERLLATASREGVTLSDELMTLQGGDNFVRATATVPVEAVAAAARDSVKRLKKHDETFREEATFIIQQGLIQGWGPMRTAQELRTRLGITKGKAETIARTEIISAQDSATRANYKANGVDQVVRIGTQDERICPYCAARAGQVYNVDEAPAAIHPRDRCYNAPFLGNEDPEDTEWIKRHAADVRGRSPDGINEGPAPFERAARTSAPKALWTPQSGWVDREAQDRARARNLNLFLKDLIQRPEQPTEEEAQSNELLQALVIGAGIVGVGIGSYYLARARYRAGFPKSAQMARDMMKDLDLSDPGDADQITFVAGGFAGQKGMSGLEYAPYFGEFLEGHHMVGVPVPEIDLGDPITKNALNNITTNWSNLLGTAVIDGRSVAAIRMAAMAAKHYEQYGKPVNLIGYSSGGFVASEAVEILREMGIPTRAVTVGSPWFGFTSLSPDEHLGLMGSGDLFRRLPVQNRLELTDVDDHWLDRYLGSEQARQAIRDFFGTSQSPPNRGDLVKRRSPSDYEVTVEVITELYPELAQLPERDIRQLPAGPQRKLLEARQDPRQLEAAPARPELRGYKELLALPEGRQAIALLQASKDPKIRALLTGSPELLALPAGAELKALPGYEELLALPEGKQVLGLLAAAIDPKMLEGAPDLLALPEARKAFGLLVGVPDMTALPAAKEFKALPPAYKELLALPPSDRPAFLASGQLPYYAIPENLRQELEQQVRLMTPVERQAVQTRTQQQIYKLARQQEREAARAATFRLQGELKAIAQTDLPPGQKLDQYRSVIFDEVSKLGVTETITPPGAPKPEEMLRFELGGVTWYVPANVKQGSPQIDLIRRFVEIAPPPELLQGTREIYLSRQTSTSETYWRKKMKMLGAQVPAASTFESGAITFYRGKAKADEMLRQMGYLKAYDLYGQLEPPERSLFRDAMLEGRPSTAYALTSPAHDFADSVKEFLLDPEHLQRFAPRRFEALQRILNYTPAYTPRPRRPDTKSAQVIEQVREKTTTLLEDLKVAQETVQGTAQKQRSTKVVQKALEIDAAPLQTQAEQAAISIRAQEQSINRLQGTVQYLEQRRAQILNPFNKPYFTDVPQQIRQAKAAIATVERDLKSLAGIRKQLATTRAQISKVESTIENLANQKQTQKPNEQAETVNRALNDTIDLVNDAENELIGLPRSPERSQALRDIQRIRATVVSQSNVLTVGELHRRELQPLLSSLRQVSDRLEGIQNRINQTEANALALKQRLNRLPQRVSDLPKSQADQYAAIKRTRAAQSKLPAKVDRYRQIREQYTGTLAEQQAKVQQLNDNYEEQRNSTQNNMSASIDRKLGQMRASIATLAALPRGSVVFLTSRRDWEYLPDADALPEDAKLLVQGQQGKTLQEKLEAAQKFVVLELGKIKVSVDAIRKDLDYVQNFSTAQLAELDAITQQWEAISRAIQTEGGTLTEATQKKKAANPESIKPEDVVKSGNQIIQELDQYNEEFVQILLREESVDPKAIIDQSELYRRAREAFSEETLKTQEYLLGEIQDGLTTAELLRRRIERDTQEQPRLQVDGKALTPDEIEALLSEADALIKQYLTIPQISVQVEETESELLRQAENQAKADRIATLRNQFNSLQAQLGSLQLEINKRNEARERGQKRGIATDRLEAERNAILKQMEDLARRIDEV